MTDADLAAALLAAVKAQDFASTADGLFGKAPIGRFPSIDLAVVAFAEGRAPLAANVLFSREHPQGLVAAFADACGAVRNIHTLQDHTDAAGESYLWLPHTDWQRVPFSTLAGDRCAPRVVAPYPASLLKVMVLTGIAHGIDGGRLQWGMPWEHDGQALAVRDWAEDMIVVSSNRATSAMVALLHHAGLIRREAHGEAHNAVNALFAAAGLATLRLTDTRADGGWTNGAGSGVGHIHMTAWDTARLLWLLDAEAPPAPWRAKDAPPLLSPACTQVVREMLEAQALHEVLSSTSLAARTDWQPGIPARLPKRWIDDAGGVAAPGYRRAGDVRTANAAADVHFAHKTGTTQNYLADAGIVRGIAPARRHYLVALLCNLGTRYAPDDACATTWRIPALGKAIDDALVARLGR